MSTVSPSRVTKKPPIQIVINMKRFSNTGVQGTGAEDVNCPFCGSTDTTLEQRKGSAICRKLFMCQECKQPFEQFD